MRNLFKYVGLRHLQLKPLRTILTTIGVSLGIALFIGISIINRSTLSSFKESIDAVAGKATLTVAAGEMGFPEEKLETIQKTPGIKHAVPMIESRGYFADNTQASETLIILGVDLLKEQSVRTYKMTDEQVIDDPLTFLNQPDSIIVTHAFAKQHSLQLDSTFDLATARGRKTFTVRGLLSPEGPAKAYGGAVAIMDIDGARFTFAKEGKLDRVDIVTAPDQDIAQVQKRLEQALGPGYQVERPETQNENMERMVKSYQVMIAFFSTLALIVGLFLITNSISIAVAERKREIGTLRALGAERKGILALFLSEAVAMGAIGALLGAWLGRILASLLVGMVAHSMSLQYLTRIEVTRLDFGPRDVVQAVLLGAAAAFVAALIPALKATTIQPLEAMRNREVGEESAQKGLYRYSPYVGLGLFALMGVSLALKLPARYPLTDTINQIFAMLGAALIGPSIVATLIRLFRPIALPLGGTVTRLAQDNLLRNPKRTGSNVMSLMIGLMLVIIIAVVNASFKLTLIDWFGRILRADILVSSSGRMISYQTQPLHEELGKELAKIPGVRLEKNGSAFALRFVHVRHGDKQLGLKAYDEPLPSDHYAVLDTRDRTPDEVGQELYHSPDPTVAVSENLTLHLGKKTGDTIELDTPSGHVSFRIVGVIVDYASPEGVLYMSREVYKKYWNDPLVSVFGIKLTPGASREEVRREIDRQFGRSKNLITVSNSELKDQLIETIDQSFAYTRAVEGAALLVGLLGLLNTLLISVMERMRELGMLRAVGMSRGQLSKMILQEALIQGGFGAVAAVFLGSIVTYLWVKNSLAHVLGWMIDFHFPWMAVARTVLVGIGVALIAGFFPAKRASNLEIRDALEYE